MCTVSYINTGKGILITSNRDEKSIRPKAIPPQEYLLKNGNACFPKDTQAGGTWIAVHENGNAMVLLNGALSAHIPLEKYRRSRGLIFTDIFSEDNLVYHFQFVIDLQDIEPFTLIIWQDEQLFECIWDGNEKITNQLDKNEAHIRSSVTLYDTPNRKKREYWFAKWLTQIISPTQKDALHFHEFTGDGDAANDLKMNRNSFYKTVSITGIHITAMQIEIVYKDLLSNESYTSSFNQKQIV
jgi:uncharacterized protein with NRDE domain